MINKCVPAPSQKRLIADACRESDGARRRLFLGALVAAAWSGSALGFASNLTANSWPTAAPALMYRDPTRQPILAATLAGKRVVAVGLRGVIIYSEDANTYVQAVVPVSADFTAVVFIDDKHGWAVGTDGVIVSTADGGKHWGLQRQTFGTDERLFSVMFITPTDGFAVGSFGLCLKTNDGGANWVTVDVAHDGSGAPHLYQLLHGRAGETLIIGEFGSIFRSAPGGQWRKIASPVQRSLFGGTVCGDLLVAIGLHGTVLTSEDGGVVWRHADVGDAPGVMGAICSPTQQLVLFDARGSLFRSCDGGRSFAGTEPSAKMTATCAVWPTAHRAPLFFSLNGVVNSALSESNKKSKFVTNCVRTRSGA